MNKRDLMLLVVAIGFGLLASLMVSRYLQRASNPGQSFVVAETAIKKGEIILKEHVKLSEPMTDASPDNLFLQVNDVIGKTTLVDIKRGALVGRNEVELKKVEEEKEVKVESLPIPPGMRAIDIPSENVFHIPDLLFMGSYIDIVGKVSETEAAASMRTVLHSAQVLSVSANEKNVVKSFSVAVSPSEAEAVADALALGKVQVIVRSEPGDKPRFVHSSGVMEVVRGVKQGQAVSFSNSGKIWGGKK